MHAQFMCFNWFRVHRQWEICQWEIFFKICFASACIIHVLLFVSECIDNATFKLGAILIFYSFFFTLFSVLLFYSFFSTLFSILIFYSFFSTLFCTHFLLIFFNSVLYSFLNSVLYSFFTHFFSTLFYTHFSTLFYTHLLLIFFRDKKMSADKSKHKTFQNFLPCK